MSIPISSPLQPPAKPLTLEDKDILKLVYDHFVVSSSNELEKPFDHEALFTNVVSDVFVRSLRTCDPNITEFDLTRVEKTTAQVESPIDLLKRLACQMRDTKREDENRSNAHEKTMWVLKTMESYSWCAKAVIALAAFGLEFGIFWDLYEQKISAATKDSLGYSLAVLNNVNEFDTTKKAKDILGYNDVVKNVYKAVRFIVDLGRFISMYDSKNLPTLLEVMHIYSAYVYWTVLAIVVLASQLDVLSGAPYNLTDISTKISSVRLQLEDYKKTIEKEIEKWKEYRNRENDAFVSPKDIVQVLKCLLFPLDQDLPKGIIVDFKTNYALVFISGLYSIDDEINLLNKICEELKQSQPRIVRRYRKDQTVIEFKKDQLKILWAPIVHEDSDEINRRFHVMRRKMKWHVVDYTIIPQLCKDLIKNRLNYDNMNPIVPLFSPQGELLNDNALHILFTWGIQAFPWRLGDAPVEKSNWIWNELQKSNHIINTWLNENAYIIVSGRTDSDWSDDQWVMKLPRELEKIRNDDIIRRFDIIIRYCRHGEKDKDESETIAKFWTYVESTFDGLRRMNKEEVDEETFRQVKLFLGVRQDRTSWVVLSKGASVKRICHGELFYQTLTEFSKWRQNIEKDAGFDVSLLRHYDYLKSQQKPLICSHITLKTHLYDIYKPVTCPEPKCQHPMKFKSAVFECCHGQHEADRSDNIINAADLAGGGDVIEITRPDSSS